MNRRAHAPNRRDAEHTASHRWRGPFASATSQRWICNKPATGSTSAKRSRWPVPRERRQPPQNVG